jgi:hypothetical protein
VINGDSIQIFPGLVSSFQFSNVAAFSVIYNGIKIIPERFREKWEKKIVELTNS